MVTTTRRMDIGDLMDAAGSLYLQNAVLFISVFGIGIVVQAILTVIAPVLSIIGSLVTFVATAALLNAVAMRIEGRPMTVGAAYRSLPFSTYLALFAAMILYWLIVVAGLVLIIIPGIYLLVRLILVPQVVVIERTDVFQAFSRSWHLVAGNWWRTFLAGLILLILYALVSGTALAIGHAGSLIALLVQLLAMPFIYAVLTEWYFNLRTTHGEPRIPEAGLPGLGA